MYYEQHTSEDELLDRKAEEVKAEEKVLQKPELDDEAREGAAIAISRARESINARDGMLASTKYFADTLLVVGLWATVEQFAGRTLSATEHELGMPEVESPHIWPQLAVRFAAVGVVVGTLKAYHDIDECRVLNNKIKHTGKVDDQLSGFTAFAGKKGTPLEKVEMELQRYTNGVFEFVGHLMESCDAVVAARPGPGRQPFGS